MKTTFITSLFFFLTLSSFAQVLNQRDWLLSGGLMVGRGGLVPIVVNAEKGVLKNVGVGGKLIRVSSKEELFGDKIHLTVLGVTGNYHAAELLKITNDRFDPYAGATVGVGVISWDGELFTTPLLFNLQVGTRYYLGKNLAGYGQINLGGSEELGTTLEVGLTYRLRR